MYKKTQITAIIAVIIIGLLLALLILRTDKPEPTGGEHEHHERADSESNERPQHGEPGHDHEKDHLPLSKENESPPHAHDHDPQAQEILKGPHGGKLFTQDGYGLEVTIFEQNVAPEFRVYTYMNNKPLDPASSMLTFTLQRLGAKPELITFVKQENYLKSNLSIKEPHSFNLKINAKHNAKDYQFTYEQVEARVRMTDEQLRLNSIELLTAGPASIKSTLQLQGEVKLNADKSVQIVSRVGGIVESVSVSAGDTVKKGQVLASISSQEIADMRSDLYAAQKRVGLARSTYVREKQLWEEKISAQQDYLQAEHDLREAEINAQRLQQKLNAVGASVSAKGLTRYELRSPINGVVTNKKISQGQVISEVDSLFEISDLSTVWVEMNIYAKDINIVKVGQKVTISATGLDVISTGTISYVGALVGEQTRTAMARVVIDNSQRSWLAGLPVNIELVSDEVKVPLAVSIEGLQTLGDWNVVFGRYGEYFEARPLNLGRRDDKYVEVFEGIEAGTRYAAGNSFLIKADIGKAGASHDH
jgi:cobalt-zinc-cadmium efflux system membrane fusion protein